MFVEVGESSSGTVAAIDAIAAGVDKLLTAGFPIGGADQTAEVIAGLERECRRLQAAQVELLDAVDRSGVYSVDGHFSAKVMLRHHAQLSGSESAQRQRLMRAMRDLPEIAEAYQAGRIGTCQARLIAKVWSNPRVRDMLAVCEPQFLEAAGLEYPDFELFCRNWTEAVDADGAHSNSQRQWDRRHIGHTQDFNGSWKLDGRLTSVHGVQLHELLDQLTQAERLIDIEAAKAEHGEHWRQHLARTPAQLRYDAFIKLVLNPPADTVAASVVTNIVIDQQSFEQQLAALCGADPQPVIPDQIAKDILSGARYCHTANGIWVNPAEVVAEALVGHVRRVVINPKGIVTNIGHRQRLFTGSTRLAALLQSTRCYWHGCWAPASHCDIDHLTPHRSGGKTTPQNGQPLCRFHNLIKESGYQSHREPDGTIQILRPDGTPIPTHTNQPKQTRAG